MVHLTFPAFLEAGLSLTKGPGDSALILRRAGIAALVVSLSAGMISNLLFLAAFQFRFERFLEPTLILGSGRTPAELLRWAAVLDLFGYYFATAVLAYVLWGSCARAIRSSPICRPSPRSATRWQAGLARQSLPWLRPC
jgi:hypothetical protein